MSLNALTHWIRVLGLLGLLSVGLTMSAIADTNDTHRIPVLIIGIGHLVAHRDVYNQTIDDPLGTDRQKQIITAMNNIAQFHPTKVLVEANYGDPAIVQRYQQYLNGTYTLGPNEIYQYGFRLAAMSHNKSIYPIDTVKDFPFDFDSVTAAAKKYGQTSILESMKGNVAPMLAAEDTVVKTGTILQWLAFLNEPRMLDINASWYMYVDRVGSGNDYPGADLVSYWYARNLHIFANIARTIDSPDDRIVVFIGQGHAAQLRDYVRLSPDMQLIDPEQYLESSDTKSN